MNETTIQFDKEILSLILEEKLTIAEIEEIKNVSVQKIISSISRLKNNNQLPNDYIILKNQNQEKILETQKENTNIINDDSIEIVKVIFDQIQHIDYNKLFDGFDELYAITYSSSPDFIYNLSQKFNKMEIIFGNSNTLNNTSANLLAAQMKSIELIKQSKYTTALIDKINNGTLNVYLLKDKISHEKIYILKNNEKTRVIIGSANMSSCAFNGKQRENISYMDELDAYRYYKNLFEEVKLTSTTELDFNTINLKEQTKIEETPLYGIIKEKEYIYIKDEENDELITFTTDVKNIEENIRQYLPETIKNKKTLKRKLTFDHLQKAIIKRDLMIEEEKEERKEFPKFNVNIKDASVTLNDIDFKEYTVNTYKDSSVKKDIILMNNFVKGFDHFIGDKQHSKDCFWKLLNYTFASPVFAQCRKYCSKYGFNVWEFPMFGIIYGQSNGGKTAMVTLIEQLMFGTTFPDNESDVFTSTRIFPLKAKMEGVPIVVNDLDKDHWNTHSGKIIKQDSYELNSKYNAPICLITSNDIQSLKPEISKRCVMLNVSAKITDVTALENAKMVNDILAQISPKFYLAYLDKFIPKLNQMIENMQNGENPDVFKISSEALIEVIVQHCGKLLSYMKPLTKEDYFGESQKGYNVLRELKKEFLHNKEAFIIDQKRNVLEISYENNYDAKKIYNELPKSMNAEIRGRKLVMDLEQSLKFLDIELPKKNIFDKFISFNKTIQK